VTLQEPKTPPSAEPDDPDTQVMVPPSSASPVFVDSTGRRRRLLRRVSYAFGAFCMLYGGLVSVSLAGGPVSPHAVLPLQALADGGSDETGSDEALSGPSPTPESSASAAPKPVYIAEPLPRRAGPRRVLERAAQPPKPPAANPTKTPAPRSAPSSTPPSSRPAESASTTPPASASPSSTPPSSTPPPTQGPAPKPPAAASSAPTGGGGSVGEDDEVVAESALPTASATISADFRTDASTGDDPPAAAAGASSAGGTEVSA
jgi:hypothetical protein